MIESNEDTFKPDTVFDSFHHQAKIPISGRALLAEFLILWLKWYVVPIIVTDVVYPTVVLIHGRPFSLLSAMVGCPQSRLQILCQSLCNVVAKEDREGNVVVDPNGEPRMKTQNPRIKLPYTYLMAWYVMNSPPLMTAMQSFEDSMPFVQRLERSTWNGWYMLIIRQILQSNMNYLLVRCFPDFPVW